MALTKTERQRKYREKQKPTNEKTYLEKERNRKTKSYIPSKELKLKDRKDLERNEKKKVSNSVGICTQYDL